MWTDPNFAQGITLFNDGRYFEAHEIWEDLWRIVDLPEREYLQGLIQLSVGLHHRERQNFIGADGQLTKALAKLKRFPLDYAGIDNGALIQEVEEALRSRAPVVTVRITRLA